MIDKILLPEQSRESEDFELFHETTKYDRFTIGQHTGNIVRYLSDPVTIYSTTRNLKAFSNSPKLHLPRCEIKTQTLRNSFRARTSCHRFTDQPLSQAQLSRLLYEAVGATRSEKNAITDTPVYKRAYPSGGALYPVEIYLLLRNVEGISPCIAHYDPLNHCLSVLSKDMDQDVLLSALLIDKPGLREVPVVALFTSLSQRSTAKYGNRGYRFALIEAGHAAQNIALSATAEGLGSLAWGSFYDDEINDIVRADGVNESIVHCLLLGKPAHDQDVKPENDEQYALSSIIEADILRAVDGRLSINTSVTALLARDTTFTNMLARVNQHPESKLRRLDSRLFVISYQPLDQTLLDKLRSLLNDESTALGQRYQKSTLQIVIEIGNFDYASYTSTQISAAAHIHIKQEQLDFGRIVHELTHALCLSGNRFLDEGLAMVEQARHCGSESLRTLVERDLTEPQLADLPPWKDIRKDIINYANAGQVLDDTGDRDVYARSYTFVSLLDQKLGSMELYSLFDRLAQLNDRSDYALTLQEVMYMLEEAEKIEQSASLFETPNTIEDAIAKARSTPSNNKELNELLDRQLETDMSNPQNQFLALRLWGTLVRVFRLSRTPVSNEMIEGFIKLYKDVDEIVQNHPLTRVAYCQVIIAKLATGEGAEARTLVPAYMQQYSLALEDELDHPTIYIDSAMADYYNERRNPMPNYESVKLKLRKACQSDRYGHEAKRHLQRFGLED